MQIGYLGSTVVLVGTAGDQTVSPWQPRRGHQRCTPRRQARPLDEFGELEGFRDGEHTVEAPRRTRKASVCLSVGSSAYAFRRGRAPRAAPSPMIQSAWRPVSCPERHARSTPTHPGSQSPPAKCSLSTFSSNDLRFRFLETTPGFGRKTLNRVFPWSVWSPLQSASHSFTAPRHFAPPYDPRSVALPRARSESLYSAQRT